MKKSDKKRYNENKMYEKKYKTIKINETFVQ